MANLVDPSFFELATSVIGVSSLCYYIVRRFTRLPLTVGLVLISLALGLSIIAVDRLAPGLALRPAVEEMLERIDFTEFVLNGILSYLIFAAAMEIDLSTLRQRWKSVTVLATAGVAISTVVFGMLQPQIVAISSVAALLLGSMQSATDPVSVSALLKRLPSVPETFKVKLAAESLLNDGVAVVVFMAILPFAAASGEHPATLLGAVALFGQEAGGGLLLGAAAAGLAFLAIRSVDDPVLEILLSVLAVMATYALSIRLHVSGPLAMVVLGIVMGNHGLAHAVSKASREQMRHFWELVDVVLNTVLFTLIGLEVLVVYLDVRHFLFAAAAILTSLIARYISVLVPIKLLDRLTDEKALPGAVSVLTWGGLRGGILVALALALPASMPEKSLLLAGAYGIVLFTVVVQGLTVEPLVCKTIGTFPKAR